MADKLNRDSQGVVHSTAVRTRLRLPSDYRSRTVLRELEQHVQQVEGVKYAEYNDKTGSIVIYHEADDHILDRIGTSIASYNADLFEIMVAPKPAPSGNVLSLFNSQQSKSTTGDGTVKLTKQAAGLIKKSLPVFLVALGAYRIFERNTLMAAIPSLGIIYLVYELERNRAGHSTPAKSRIQRISKKPGGDVTT